jgi:hypothetical protein
MSFTQTGVFRHPPQPQVFRGLPAVEIPLAPSHFGAAGSYGDPGRGNLFRKRPREQVFRGQVALLFPTALTPTPIPDLMAKWRVTPGYGKTGVFRSQPYIQQFTGIASNLISQVDDTRPLFAGKFKQIQWPDTRQYERYRLPVVNWAPVITPQPTPLAYGPVTALWKDPYTWEFQSQPNLKDAGLFTDTFIKAHYMVPVGGIKMAGMAAAINHARSFYPSGGIKLGGNPGVNMPQTIRQQPISSLVYNPRIRRLTRRYIRPLAMIAILMLMM